MSKYLLHSAVGMCMIMYIYLAPITSSHTSCTFYLKLQNSTHLLMLFFFFIKLYCITQILIVAKHIECSGPKDLPDSSAGITEILYEVTSAMFPFIPFSPILSKGIKLASLNHSLVKVKSSRLSS